MSASADREILNIEEAAALLGVSVKTFNKVLHAENIPARKIGREWKFARTALIGWVGNGRSMDFYREAGEGQRHPHEPREDSTANRRRTAGWQIEVD